MTEKLERNTMIRADRARGDSLKVIAARYCVSLSRAAQIISARPLTPIEREGKLLIEVEEILKLIAQKSFTLGAKELRQCAD